MSGAVLDTGDSAVNKRSQVLALKELQQGSGEFTNNSGWLQQRVVGIMKKNKTE